jgi:molecular chaperone GrpE
MPADRLGSGMTDDADEARGSDHETAGEDASDAREADVDYDALVSRAEDADPDLAEDVRELVAHTREVEAALQQRAAEVEDLEGRLKRTQADFQNYKKRAKKRQDQIRERATEDFVERVVSVRDNLVRALDQPEDADIRGGVESTLAEFDRVLDEEGVSPIEPEPGAEVDPQRHEVMMRVESDQPEDTVADTFQAGYEMAGSVIRAAQVTVSDGPAADDTGDETAASPDAETDGGDDVV